MRFTILPAFALLLAGLSLPALAQDAAVAPTPLTIDAILNADVAQALTPKVAPPVDASSAAPEASSAASDASGSSEAVAAEPAPPATPDPGIVKLQILLDREGVSPGVIDGFNGDNVAKALRAFAIMQGLPDSPEAVTQVLAALPPGDPVLGAYTITEEDVTSIVAPIPSDYAEMAKRDFLGYTSVPELLGERFHMDVDLLKALNPSAQFVAGEKVAVAVPGANKEGKVARIEADKGDRQVRAYDAEGKLLVAYPATIGNTDNPSPSGTHLVNAVAPMPNYTYNPEVNFQQGKNTEKLIIPPGPNGPVGSVWIDLTEPTFGIHGTPEPSKIDKTNSHGCVRLTNWDAEELSKMVEPGVPVEFID